LLRLNRSNFVILEKGDDVGGTWHDNTYPGCACDIPSVLYSFSFMKYKWSHPFSYQPQILEYLRDVTEEYGLRRHIRFGSHVYRADWSDDERRWHVLTADGLEFVCKYMVSGIGALHIPSIPDIPGRDEFYGVQFHSAEWDHGVDLTDKKVATIGTGASSIQIVPGIIDQIAGLQLYQRTPAWVLPRPNGALPQPLPTLIEKVPGLYQVLRSIVFMAQELLGYAMTRRPILLKVVERLAKWHLYRTVEDPELRAKLLPDFRAGCKRLLNDIDGFYEALTREKSEVITDRIAKFTPNGIVTADGVERDVDVVVWATGFHVTDSYMYVGIKGANGVDLVDMWDREGVSAHRGVTVNHMPNLFFLLGPNTGLGHNSVVSMIEPQIKYIGKLMQAVEDQGAEALYPTPQAQQKFNDEVQAKLAKSIWNTGGCRSWYFDEHGVNRTLWSGTVRKYRKVLDRIRLDEYKLF
jgi:cation diffusion facilitator CzcD-associated flavoprotein CzcO